MPALLTRLRTFRTPREVLLLLALGLIVTAFGKLRIGAGADARPGEIAALDSAIRASTPTAEDTSAASVEKLRVLVSKKRDIESAAEQQNRGALYLLMGGSLLVTGAVVLGGVALLSALRADPD